MVEFLKYIISKEGNKSEVAQIDTSKVPTRIPGKVEGVTIESIVKDYFESRPEQIEYTINNDDDSITIYKRTK